MFKKTTSSIACLTIMATSIGALNANASEQTEGSQKGTMGYGYQKYLKNHPNEQSNATSNRSTFSTKSKVITTQNGDRVLDISEWQGNLTDSQVKQLKKDYNFIIIRGQYGSEYVDQCLENNSALLDKNNMKFGVYSYSLYENADDARNEAQTLYSRAPKASFYVNDFEQNSITSGDADTATKAWADEMKQLAGNKKVLFYSYENFMTNDVPNAVSAYDGYWLAAYQEQEPNREKVLWQYTDSYYAPELNQNVDANYIDANVTADWFTS